nr:hypothetical protein [Tanacetum cinerariifolium]
MSAKDSDKKQKEIVVVRDFLEVFLDDLSGFPPPLEIEYRIELIPRAIPIAKSLHRLAPSELEELSRQLKELQDKDSRGACRTIKVSLRNTQERETGEEQELKFQTLKDKLCNAPVLALPDRPKDFVVYYDVSGLGLGCVLMQRELFSDYDCEIGYHPSKVNVLANALSRKERVKPKRVRAMNMALQLNIKDRILAAQKEAVDEYVGLQKDEAHKLKYSIHPRADKMYHDHRDRYWWPGMKKDIAVYVRIAIDFVTRLPRTSSGHDIIGVIVNRLTKSSHFLPIREDYKMDRLARLYLNEILTIHGVPISIISDRDSRFTSRFWQSMQEALGTRLDMSTAYHPRIDGQSKRTIHTLEDMLRACILDFEGSWDVHLPLVDFSYNNRSHSSVRCASFEALYGRKSRSPIIWVEVGEGQLIGPEYGTLWEERKLAPRFVEPFEIIKKVGLVAYMLNFPKELDGVQDTFHVSNLKKCLADPTLQMPLDEIQVDAKLNFVEEHVKIFEREFKNLKRSRISIVKVR